MPILDALQYVGETLDKPGAAVRGLLAGRPEQLANLIPFSDALGLTNPKQRVSGRGMLESWGVLGQNRPGLDAGDVAGFGVDVALDPLSLLGFGKAAAGLGRMAGRFADEAVKAPTLGVFGGAMGDFSKYGKQAQQVSPDEAMSLFKPWAESLTPEEAASMQLFTSGPQNAISSVLRGIEPSTPLKQLISDDRISAPAINSVERVMGEVVPYADSAISKGAGVLPEDIVTYRLADQLGELTAENARSMIGKTVSDPSYLSTTVTPYGRFYGNNTGTPGKSMLLDILRPKGSQGAFPNAGGLSRYPDELEIVLPRNTPMKVLDAKDVPVAIHDYDNIRLTPDGRPIPLAGSDAGMGVLFDEDKLWELSKQHPAFSTGTFEVPPNLDEILAPGWEKALADMPRSSFTNVLLEAMDPTSYANPTTRRLLEAERGEVLKRLAPKARENVASYNLSRFDELAKSSDPFKLRLLENYINQAMGLYSGKLGDMLKLSAPKDDPIGGMLEVLKRAGLPIAGLGGAMSPLMRSLHGEVA